MDKPRIDLTGREFIEWNRLLKVEFRTDSPEVQILRNRIVRMMDARGYHHGDRISESWIVRLFRTH